MNQNPNAITRSRESALASNSLIRNTYMLLSMTLLFSAVVAYVAFELRLPHPGLILSLVGMFGLLFLVHKTANSAMGLVSVFGFTGFMGYTLGPVLNAYVGAYINGTELIVQSMVGTAAVFIGLSLYALSSRKDFSFMGGFLMVGLILIIIAGIANIFLAIPALSLTISGAAVLVMSGLILFDTSRMVHGGETNYIRMTVNLFLDVYLLFVHLLNLLGALSGQR